VCAECVHRRSIGVDHDPRRETHRSICLDRSQRDDQELWRPDRPLPFPRFQRRQHPLAEAARGVPEEDERTLASAGEIRCTAVEIGKNEGAKMMCGGNRLDKGDYQYGWFMEPTVFSDVDPKMRIAQEEIFGPVVSIIPCDDLEDAIEIANGIEYGLSSALYTKDVNKAFAAIRDLYAGITYINAPTIGAEVHLPFGGTKATGNGHREGGIGAIDFYTEWKSVYVDYSDKLQKAQIDRAE